MVIIKPGHGRPEGLTRASRSFVQTSESFDYIPVFAVKTLAPAPWFYLDAWQGGVNTRTQSAVAYKKGMYREARKVETNKTMQLK